ncbi:MAG TPA: DUF2279 domain-containing protein [Bacteroidia bacterium]|nr:DUF2279 domain-containing protein [Bacteroidia bacterium]
MLRLLPLLIILFSAAPLKALTRSDSLNSRQIRTRRIVLISSTGAAGAGSLLYLNEAWYKDYKTENFHFFNDGQEWLQMDKLGHAFSTYQCGRLMMQAFDWAGYSGAQKLWIGGAMGFYYMSLVECLDGFSEGWGFSWPDELANACGAGLAMAQEALWKEQRVQLKFFYHNSGLAGYNAQLLGNTAYTRPIKDYNGQSYWLSFTPATFMHRKCVLPSWLNISLGYGASGMIGANQNPQLKDAQGNPISLERYRRVFLSLDLDLTRLPVRNKNLRALLSVLNVIKFPAPTLEFSQGHFTFHALYP